MPEVSPCTTPEEILKFQWLVRQVPVSETVNRFAVDLVRATRPDDPNAPDVVRRYVQYGASVRATMFLTLAAKASALMRRQIPRNARGHRRARIAGHEASCIDELFRGVRWHQTRMKS